MFSPWTILDNLAPEGREDLSALHTLSPGCIPTPVASIFYVLSSFILLDKVGGLGTLQTTLFSFIVAFTPRSQFTIASNTGVAALVK